jgi:hypothetical protein
MSDQTAVLDSPQPADSLCCQGKGNLLNLSVGNRVLQAAKLTGKTVGAVRVTLDATGTMLVAPFRPRPRPPAVVAAKAMRKAQKRIARLESADEELDTASGAVERKKELRELRGLVGKIEETVGLLGERLKQTVLEEKPEVSATEKPAKAPGRKQAAKPFADQDKPSQDVAKGEKSAPPSGEQESLFSPMLAERHPRDRVEGNEGEANEAPKESGDKNPQTAPKRKSASSSPGAAEPKPSAERPAKRASQKKSPGA